jgi:hypothetical protein
MVGSKAEYHVPAPAIWPQVCITRHDACMPVIKNRRRERKNIRLRTGKYMPPVCAANTYRLLIYNFKSRPIYFRRDEKSKYSTPCLAAII